MSFNDLQPSFESATDTLYSLDLHTCNNYYGAKPSAPNSHAPLDFDRQDEE